MYVIFAVAILLVAGLFYLLDRALKTVNKGRRRREVAIRLVSAAAEAEERDRQRKAAADASAALTMVLPAIQEPERSPRRVT